jgi:acyl-coenzyme A thioesterase PaaI-like protein
VPGFDDDIALRPTGQGAWEGAIAPGWDTPRGPLGGYVMAILMRGFDLAVDDPQRQARSVTVHFLRTPEAGPVEVFATVEREGRSLSTVSGRLEQDGKLIALGLGAYSVAWESPFLEPPDGIPDVPPASSASRPGAAGSAGDAGDFPRKDPPPFTERLIMQHRFGEMPFSGADRGEVGGWLGLLERRPLDAPAIAMLADAWFPAPWPRLAELAPAPTIDLTVHFMAPLPLADDLLLGRFTSKLVRDGFFDEDGELWTPDGTLVAQSRQLGLLLGARV